jgi:outer membrane receptor protein involved in Fe transport
MNSYSNVQIHTALPIAFLSLPVSVLAEDIETPFNTERLVVTAVANPLDSLRYAGSNSVLYREQIDRAVPTNATDILRFIPGIFAHSSGGEGNANVTTRGMLHTGGARYTLFQEDGLPILEFGDINFATADTFLRYDKNIERVEVVRGGSASTFVSNAPFGVFNFISKTGEETGGSIGYSRGLNFERNRLDFDYGETVNSDWRYHVGGLFRVGEGSKTINYQAESGGQLKANVTRLFGDNFVRFNVKLLNDRSPVYLPVPVGLTGTEDNPNVSAITGFDIRKNAMQSKYFRHDLAVNKDGQTIRTNIDDGYYSDVKAIGGEAQFKLSNQWKLNNKFRYSNISGRFVGPYPAEVKTASSLATDIGGAGATLRYANGPNAGQVISNPDSLNGNGLALRTHLFNVTLEDMSHIANDFKLSKVFRDQEFGSTEVTLGYYKSRQYIKQDWHWNSYLQEVKAKMPCYLMSMMRPITRSPRMA